MNRWKSLKVGTALFVALSILGVAPAAVAGERYGRQNSYSNSYSYDRNYRDDGDRYNNSYRDDRYRNSDPYYSGRDNYRPFGRAGRSVAIVGGGAAAGAIVGAIAGGGKGAAIGAAVGGVGGLIYDRASKHRNRY